MELSVFVGHPRYDDHILFASIVRQPNLCGRVVLDDLWRRGRYAGNPLSDGQAGLYVRVVRGEDEE